MTREEAIVIMQNEQPHCGKGVVFTEEEKCEAFEMAIEALKAEPCENAIGREAVNSFINKRVNCLEERMSSANNEGRWAEEEQCQCAIENLEFIKEYIEALSFVTPKPKAGH